MNIRIAAALVVSAVSLSMACASTPPAETSGSASAQAQELQKLTVEQVDAKVTAGEKNFFVFDNNDADRFKKGHVPGATNVNSSAVTASTLPADKAATLVFYCGSESCSACQDAAKSALSLGYTHVYIMPEGIAGWEKKGMKTAT